LNERLGVDKIFTTAYHPQTDGTAEKLIQFVTCALAAYINESQDDLEFYLPCVAAAYRIFVDCVKNTPFYILYARYPTLHTDVLYGSRASIQEDVDKYNIGHTRHLRVVFVRATSAQSKYFEKCKQYYDKSHKSISFKKGDLVLLKIAVLQGNRCRKFDQRFEGPYEVIEVHSVFNYTIRCKTTGREWRVHVQRMESSCSDRKSESDVVEIEGEVNVVEIEDEVRSLPESKEDDGLDVQSDVSEFDISLLDNPFITSSRLNEFQEREYLIESGDDFISWSCC
jgi:hypothetical protein